MKENKLKSRKLWAFIGTILAGFAAPHLIPLLTIAGPAYIAGQAAVDAVRALVERGKG